MSTEPTREEVERLKEEIGLADAPETLLRFLSAATAPDSEMDPFEAADDIHRRCGS